MDTVASPIQTPVRPQKTFPLLPILLSVLILFLLGSTIFLAYQNMQLQKQIALLQTAPTPTPRPSESPPQDPTANWKTYTNSAYGYTLQYSDTWTLQNAAAHPSGQAIYITSPETQKIIDNNKKVTSQKDFVEIFPDININVYSSNDPAYNFLGDYIKNSPGNNHPNQSQTITDETLGNINFKAVTMQANPSYLAYLTMHNSLYYQISFPNITSQSQMSTVERQTLATFKFIDQSSVPTPTCRPRPACLDTNPRCLIPETSDMCPPATKTACTMEAKLCPDGSSVGRTGPNCEFAPCPTP